MKERKPYRKPTLARIKLKPEESVLSYCQMSGWVCEQNVNVPS